MTTSVAWTPRHKIEIEKTNSKHKVVHVRAMKAYSGGGGTAPLICNQSTQHDSNV